MQFLKEKNFIEEQVRCMYEKYMALGVKNVVQKSMFDLVTNIDRDIEDELSAAILRRFPGDKIHGEETVHEEYMKGRMWTIDPIDGTCNMVAGIPLYGIQCSLISDGRIVLSVIYLPHFNEMYTAEEGEGCYLNGRPLKVKYGGSLNNAIISLGDYPHKYVDIAEKQHKAVAEIYPHIAKIRMFGAACLDFSMVAAGRTDAAVVITRNLWDLAPGILLCKEAGAKVTNLQGKQYSFGDNGVVVAANGECLELILNAFNY